MSEMPAQMMMQMMLRHSDIIGQSEELDKRIKPMAWQYDIEAGAKGFVAAGDARIEYDFTCIEVLEVDEAQQQRFPDWQTRMLPPSPMLLCRWFSIQDPEGDIGWFSRIRIVTLDDEQYEEMRAWQMSGFPDNPPAWMNDRFLEYTNELHQQDPVHLPEQVTCPRCNGFKVELREVRQLTQICRAGKLEREGEVRFVPISGLGANEEVSAQLYCPDCEHQMDLQDSQYHMH